MKTTTAPPSDHHSRRRCACPGSVSHPRRRLRRTAYRRSPDVSAKAIRI
nr:MAG TPA: hypothetical protein [Caudoviricetes sp.]